MSGFTFSNVGYLGLLVSGLDLSTTYARWSAAESVGGGLDGSGNWISVDGSKTLTKSGAGAFTYDATGLNGKPTLQSPNAGTNKAAFSLAGVTLPNTTVASILVMNSPSTAVQIAFELGPNLSSTPNSIGSYILFNRIENHANINSIDVTDYVPQIFIPFITSLRAYQANTSIKQSVNNTSTTITNGAANSGGFGTKTLYLGGRTASSNYLVGQVSALHIFHTAPTDVEWDKWITYYRTLYGI